MKIRVRAIIFDGNNIILMKRKKPGQKTYWCFPGGMVEKGESHKKALERECQEELGISVKVKELLLEKDLDLYENRQKEFFYLCQKTSGQLGTGNGPEYQEHNNYWGTHEPVLVRVGDISKLNILPVEAKEIVLSQILN